MDRSLDEILAERVCRKSTPHPIALPEALLTILQKSKDGPRDGRGGGQRRRERDRQQEYPRDGVRKVRLASILEQIRFQTLD